MKATQHGQSCVDHCFLCKEHATPDDPVTLYTFLDEGARGVHESCYEAARDAWADACMAADDESHD